MCGILKFYEGRSKVDCDWFETIFMGFNSPLSCEVTIGGVVKVWFGGGQPWVHSCSFLSD